MTIPPLSWLIFFAGLGQLALVAGSLAIPRVLHWREETAKLNPLTHHVFWTYAAYIWTTNLSFGLLSVSAPSWLASVVLFLTWSGDDRGKPPGASRPTDSAIALVGQSMDRRLDSHPLAHSLSSAVSTRLRLALDWNCG